MENKMKYINLTFTDQEDITDDQKTITVFINNIGAIKPFIRNDGVKETHVYSGGFAFVVQESRSEILALINAQAGIETSARITGTGAQWQK